MPNTLIPIQTYTLTGTTASVTFSNIPQNYTDLKIVASARTARADNGDYVLLSFNGAEANSAKGLWGYGTAVVSDSTTNNGLIVPGNTAMASTFGNLEVHCPNYTSSTNKSISIDASAEDNASASNGNKISVFLWSSGSASTSAVTSITLAGRFASFLSGSTFTLYGISNGVKATGGTLTVAGGYAYHTFTSTGSFLPNQKIKGAEVLVIAGGGGGGRDNFSVARRSGGGGAGGYRYFNTQTFTAGTSYTALVGSGGAGATSENGASGTDSVFAGVVSTGGGYGGGTAAASINYVGGNGGSGGGGADEGGNGNTPSTNPSQGNKGGAGWYDGSSVFGGGGGGGAGATGNGGLPANSYIATNGNGGIGSSTQSTWGSVTGTGQLVGGVYYYAGGGGCGGGSSGSGGLGGGGNGGGTAGTANTGGGGGGNRNANGGAGGSGIIIVRYPLS
jgi:hypothetical protein